MPTAKLDESLEMYYEDDDYTDPWRASAAPASRRKATNGR